MMELDDLKQTWDDANEGLGKEPGLTTIIDRIPQQNIGRSLKKSLIPKWWERSLHLLVLLT